MNARLTLPNHRIITPVAAVLVAVAFAAALALGFGLRAWTEHPSAAATPAPAAAPAPAVTPPQDLVLRGKPW